jgi:hypothetical protein
LTATAAAASADGCRRHGAPIPRNSAEIHFFTPDNTVSGGDGGSLLDSDELGSCWAFNWEQKTSCRQLINCSLVCIQDKYSDLSARWTL